MWFTIRKTNRCTDGAVNMMKSITMLRLLNEDAKKVVFPVIQRNAFFSHVENLLLAMVTDAREPVRQLGWTRIKDAGKMSSNNGIRKFKLPELNFQATDMID